LLKSSPSERGNPSNFFYRLFIKCGYALILKKGIFMFGLIVLGFITFILGWAGYTHVFGIPEEMPVDKKTGQPRKQSKASGIILLFLSCIFGLLTIGRLFSDDLKPEPPKTPEQIAQQRAIAEATRLNGERRDQLERYLKEQARDPSSIEFRNEVVVPNGVCVEMNGKNAFGGYAGWSRYCGIIDKTGKMIVSKVN
jgi:hypothetical protein